MDRNLFVEAVVPHSVKRTLSQEEPDAYRAPFTERAHRLPTLLWPREIPIDGTPADVDKRVETCGTWLSRPGRRSDSALGSSALGDASRTP